MNTTELYYKHWPTLRAIANRNARKDRTFCYAHVAYVCHARERIKAAEYSGCRFIGLTIIPNDFRGATETTEKLVCSARTTAINVASRKSSSPCLNRRESFVVLRKKENKQRQRICQYKTFTNIQFLLDYRRPIED